MNCSVEVQGNPWQLDFGGGELVGIKWKCCGNAMGGMAEREDCPVGESPGIMGGIAHARE